MTTIKQNVRKWFNNAKQMCFNDRLSYYKKKSVIHTAQKNEQFVPIMIPLYSIIIELCWITAIHLPYTCIVIT